MLLTKILQLLSAFTPLHHLNFLYLSFHRRLFQKPTRAVAYDHTAKSRPKFSQNVQLFRQEDPSKGFLDSDHSFLNIWLGNQGARRVADVRATSLSR